MKTRNNFDDSTLLAGWIFADLFLALTVIFLATVSYVPSGQKSVELAPKTEIQYNSLNFNLDSNSNLILLSNGFVGEYGKNQERVFLNDLNQFMESKGLPSNTKALFLEVIGHSSEDSTAQDKGNYSAINFIISTKKLEPTIFDGVNTSVNLSSDVSINRVRIRVAF